MYEARQIGFDDPYECPQLCKLANDYLKKTEGSESSIYEFFSNDPAPEFLYVKLIEEFDKCILSYFAFHWSQTPLMISQVNFHDNKAFTIKLLHVSYYHCKNK